MKTVSERRSILENEKLGGGRLYSTCLGKLLAYNVPIVTIFKYNGLLWTKKRIISFLLTRENKRFSVFAASQTSAFTLAPKLSLKGINGLLVYCNIT